MLNYDNFLKTTKAIVFAVCLLSCGFVFGQKEDYNWLVGYDSWAGYDTASQHWFGITHFDFNQQQVSITRDSLGMNFNRSNSSISDTNGNLIFFCNGVTVRNWADQIMQNGDTLGAGYFLEQHNPNLLYFGLGYTQPHIVLTSPLENGLYDIFHSYTDTLVNDLDIYGKKLLRTSIDMKQNAGLGKVTVKDSIISTNENTFTVVATKHGNGKDWWVLTNRTRTNCYDLFLYDGSNSLVNKLECGGSILPHGQICSMRFSTDGSKFVQASTTGHINVFDFDRCNGVLTLKEDFIIQEVIDSSSSYWWPTGLEFSPDSRFFYVFCSARIYQFDTWANNIKNSRYQVAAYSGFLGPFQQTYFYAQLAPNGKIYTCSGNSNYYVGVIDNPNGQGSSCNFLDHNIQVPTFITGLCYFPNYRLGALTGSPCDTLTGLNETARAEKEKILKAYPNPATDFVTVDYGFTDWNKGEVSLEISNELGQTVTQQHLPMYSGFQKIDVSQFAAAVYHIYIKRNNAIIAAAKFSKL